MRSLITVAALILVVAIFENTYANRKDMWPSIKPAQIKTFVSSESPKVVLDIFSDENPSEKLYTLRCNKGDSEDKVTGEDDYYGMFQCHLIVVKTLGPELLEGEGSWDLGKSYNTRGVFRYEQLIGPCKNDPEFGFHREFNMRGMKLELTIFNFSSPSIKDMLTGKVQPQFSFAFEAKVTPNILAISKFTSPSAKKYCGGYYEIDVNGEAVYHDSAN